MTKGELIRLMEDTDDDIPVVIEMRNGNKKDTIIISYRMNQGDGYYAIRGDF